MELDDGQPALGLVARTLIAFFIRLALKNLYILSLSLLLLSLLLLSLSFYHFSIGGEIVRLIKI